MTMIKGNEQEHLQIVAYSPWRRWLVRLLVLVIMGSLAAAGYGYGQYQGWHVRRAAVQESNQLREELTHSRAQVTELRQKVALLERGSQMDRQANEEVRQAMADLRAQIAKLENEVTFYKRVMAPDSTDKGLRVQSWELEATHNPRRFRYKLVLTQVADNKYYIEGRAMVNLIGSQGRTHKVSIPLRDVSNDETDLGIRFRFRYFQNIDGELTLPEGFLPEQIQVVLQSTGKKAMRVEKNFEWQAQEAA